MVILAIAWKETLKISQYLSLPRAAEDKHRQTCFKLVKKYDILLLEILIKVLKHKVKVLFMVLKERPVVQSLESLTNTVRPLYSLKCTIQPLDRQTLHCPIIEKLDNARLNGWTLIHITVRWLDSYIYTVQQWILSYYTVK